MVSLCVFVCLFVVVILGGLGFHSFTVGHVLACGTTNDRRGATRDGRLWNDECVCDGERTKDRRGLWMDGQTSSICQFCFAWLESHKSTFQAKGKAFLVPSTHQSSSSQAKNLYRRLLLVLLAVWRVLDHLPSLKHILIGQHHYVGKEAKQVWRVEDLAEPKNDIAQKREERLTQRSCLVIAHQQQQQQPNSLPKRITTSQKTQTNDDLFRRFTHNPSTHGTSYCRSRPKPQCPRIRFHGIAQGSWSYNS